MPRLLLTLMLMLTGTSLLKAQQTNPEEALIGVDGNNFFEVQSALNTFYAENPKAPGYKQWKRREWFLEPRLYPSGQRKNLTLHTMKEYAAIAKETSQNTRSTHGAWYFLGPTDWTAGAGGNAGMGRLNCVAIHPSDEDIMYVGAANGGIWKTTNGGSSWSNVSPHIPLLAIADIVIDPSDPSTVYALTGDGDPVPGESGSHLQTEVSSIGVIRSTNGGATWFPTGFSLDHPNAVIPTRLVMHPTDGDIQFIVAADGIYRTTDGWSTDSLVISGTFWDLEFHPTNPNIMYNCSTARIRRSTNMGLNWTIVAEDDDFTQFDSVTRVELAVSPASPNTVYALGVNWSSMEFLLRSTSSGAANTWTLRASSAVAMGRFGTYCVALAVDPQNINNLFGGAQWITRSSNGGTSWSSVVQSTVHADLHDIKITNNALYVACDGGLYKSTDNGATWTDLSPGLAITEIYRIAGTPQSILDFYCGVQDNGTLQKDGASTDFLTANGSDGTTCRINYRNADTAYVGQQNGVFRRTTNGGASFSTMNIPGDGGTWISPMIMDPVDPRILFFGLDSLYRTNDGGATFTYCGVPIGGNMNCLAQGTSNRNRLYASSGSTLARSDNALSNSVSFTTIDNGLPDLFITGIAVDPANSLRVFVSFGGYEDGDKVYFSSTGGAPWFSLSGSLPNVPINCIAYDSSTTNIDGLYVGTDIGVFYRDNNLGDWIYFSNNMPSVNVSDLYVSASDGVITAGTYGRGLWQSTLYTGCVANVVHSDAGNPLGGIIYRSASNSVTSSAEFKADMGTEVYYKAGDHVILTPGFRLRTQAFFEAKIGDCPGEVEGLVIAGPQVPSGQWMANDPTEVLQVDKPKD